MVTKPAKSTYPKRQPLPPSHLRVAPGTVARAKREREWRRASLVTSVLLTALALGLAVAALLIGTAVDVALALVAAVMNGMAAVEAREQIGRWSP